MFLCHVIDDFVLQPICLSKLKQKDWWIEECKKKSLKFSDYNADYLMAMWIHAMSWSIMVLLPWMLFHEINDNYLFWIFLVNAVVHFIIDDMKANKHLLNLKTDQLLHFSQISITSLICQVITAH